MLKDDETLGSLGLKGKNVTLYFKDFGPQIGWTTVSTSLHVTVASTLFM